MQRIAAAICLLVTSAAYAEPLSVYAENPRYFELDGEPVTLFGSGFWTIIPDTRVDIEEHNAWYASYGANANRAALFAFCMMDDAEPGALLTPWARTGPGNANDGGPKLDLTKWDEAFWARLNEYLSDCQERGIVVLLQMFDEPFTEGGAKRWRMNPFNPDNHINDIPNMPTGESSGEGAFYDPDNAPLMAIQDALILRLLDETVPRYGNVIYEIGNEINMDSETGKALEWQRHWIERFAAYEQEHGVELILTNDTRESLTRADAARWRAINHHAMLRTQIHRSTVAEIVGGVTESLAGAREEFAQPLLNSRPCSDPDRLNYPDIASEVQGRALYWSYLMNASHIIGFRTTVESWKAGVIAERIIQGVQRFAERIEPHRLAPHHELADGDHALCLADPGRLYAVYAPLGGSVEVDLSAVAEGKTVVAHRYDMTGANPAFGALPDASAPAATLTCPAGGEGADCAFVLEVR